MKNAIILHGTTFSPDDPTVEANWFPWLKKELIKKGYKVFLPELPDPNKPNIDNYVEHIFENWNVDDDTVIIGHSSGGTAGFWVLERLSKNLKVKHFIGVATFYTDLRHPKYLEDIAKHKYDWAKIRQSAEKITLFASNNDPYVPLEESEFIAEKLGVKLNLMKGQKHFSIGSFGEEYKKFPKLLELLEI